jgi:hypothetical protein
VLPEYIINEISDESSENSSLNSDDDDSDCSENTNEEAHVPNGSLQGIDYFSGASRGKVRWL